MISLLHFHLLSISHGLEAPMMNLSVMSSSGTIVSARFSFKKKTEKKKKLLFQFAGSALWLLLVISIYAFLLVKSCPPWKCVSSGTLTHSVPARALPLSLLMIDCCGRGSADAVVTQNDRELVSAVQEDAISAWHLPWIKPPQGLPFKLHNRLRPPQIWLFHCIRAKWKQTF